MDHHRGSNRTRAVYASDIKCYKNHIVA
jgi:hypothetical protein